MSYNLCTTEAKPRNMLQKNILGKSQAASIIHIGRKNTFRITHKLASKWVALSHMLPATAIKNSAHCLNNPYHGLNYVIEC